MIRLLALLALLKSVFGLRFINLDVETIVWTDHELIIFSSADYTNLRTVKNLGYLLESANSRSVLLRERYERIGGCHMSKEVFQSMIASMSTHLAEGKLVIRTARKFFNFNTLSRLGKLRRYFRVYGVLSFLSTVTPLITSTDRLHVAGREFVTAMLNKAPEDPDTELTIHRSKRQAILRSSLSFYLTNPKTLIFILDSRSIDKTNFVFKENLIELGFEGPSDVPNTILSLPYIVHLILCASAYRVNEGRPLGIPIKSNIDYRNRIEMLLVEALEKAQGSWEDKLIAYRKVSPFLRIVLDLELLCTCLICSEMPEEFGRRRSPKSIYSTLMTYADDERFIMSKISRTRFNLGLLALAFLEKELGANRDIRMTEIRTIIRSTFRTTDLIHVKDLSMLMVVLSDYEGHHPRAKETLSIIVDEINNNRRLSMGVLKSPIVPTTIKSMLSFKRRHQCFIHRMEVENSKMILKAEHFLAHDPSHHNEFFGPWRVIVYQRYLRFIHEFSTESFLVQHYREDVQFTRNLLVHFIPWFLRRYFTSTVETSVSPVYIRPKLTIAEGPNIRILALALKTAILLDTEFKEKILFSEYLLEMLQREWKGFGADTLTTIELSKIISNGQRKFII